MICIFGGLRAPFLLGRTRDGSVGSCHQTTPLHRRLVMLLLWLSLSPTVWAGESDPAKEAKMIPKISLNAEQGPTGLTVSPTLHSAEPGTLTFTLDLWSQGAGGRSHQRQSGGAELVANQPHALGRLSLGLACPYQVRIRLQLWQETLLLSELDQTFHCPSSP
jgi:hypothetical protein